MTKKAILFTTIALTLIATAEVEKDLHPYAKKLSFNGESGALSKFGSFEVDEEIYSSLNSKASNLRIIDERNIEVPYLLRTKRGERTVTQLKPIPFEKLSLNKLPNNQIEIELRKNSDKRYKESQISSVDLSSNLQNFEKHISIWSSNDRDSWSLIAENKAIFDYSKFIDIRNSRVSFPPTKASYIRIRISNITEKHESPYTKLSRTVQGGKELSAVESSSFTRADFRINAINCFEKTTKIIKDKTLKQPYTSSEFMVKEEEDKKSQIKFYTHRTPITKITLNTTTHFFYRRYTLETSTDGTTWRTAHAGVISSVNNDPDDTSDSRSINLLRPIQSDAFRITIQNNDSPPLKITGVELEGETREIVFYCDPAKSYRAIYGAEETERPIYDIAEVLSRTKSNATTQYTAGPEMRNVNYNASEQRKPLLSRRTVMTIAVIIMIAALGWLIAKTAKSIE